jgi:hypothetical protein
MWKMLAKASVKRCYGIIGDALNLKLDSWRRERDSNPRYLFRYSGFQVPLYDLTIVEGF